MKDKEWLKEKIVDLFHTACQIGKMEYYEADQSVHVINELIDQLDEPEKTNEEKSRYADGYDDGFADGLLNKNEPEKPVIPKFVADYIESQDDPIYEMCINYEMWGVNGDDGTASFTREIAEWFDDNLNVENYYRACIDGYEVEKEKSYEVIIGKGTLGGYPSLVVLYKSIVGVMILREMTVADYEDDKRRVPTSFWLTEQEIKDYDERYWAFAEEVTE